MGRNFFMWASWLLIGVVAVPGQDTVRVGVWAETTSRTDSVRMLANAWAQVADLETALGGPAGPGWKVRLKRWVPVTVGTLPLAGGDRNHHPDQRDSLVNVQWGFTNDSSTTAQADPAVRRAWLRALGCPDESEFRLHWDLALDSARNPLVPWDERGVVYAPPWSLRDVTVPRGCLRLLALQGAPHSLHLWDPARAGALLARALAGPLKVEVVGVGKVPLPGARLAVRRTMPDPLRPWAGRLHDRTEPVELDGEGRAHLERAAWLTSGDSSFRHDPRGSAGLFRLEATHGDRFGSRFIDALQLADLVLGGDTLRVEVDAGGSRAWSEARRQYPHRDALVVRADDDGTLRLGIALREDDPVVMRLLREGNEVLRTGTLALGRGVHERVLPAGLSPGLWIARVDGPRLRLVAEFVVPALPGQSPQDKLR